MLKNLRRKTSIFILFFQSNNYNNGISANLSYFCIQEALSCVEKCYLREALLCDCRIYRAKYILQIIGKYSLKSIDNGYV